VIASRSRAIDDPAQDSLQPVDGGRKAACVHIVEIRLVLKVRDGYFEIFEFEHTVMLSNICSIVKHS